MDSGSPPILAPTLDEVVIVGTAPLPGASVPRDLWPVAVWSRAREALRRAQSTSVAQVLDASLPAATISEVQGNPLQPDFSFRGFTASPLLGTPQGLAVYVDGVRINEPFGDTVNWDLVPDIALSKVELVPGAMPAFGLNALGGALVMYTRDGLDWQGSGLEASYGSFGRNRLGLEHGRRLGDNAWYLGVERFAETGWRDFSPSSVHRGLFKFSREVAAGRWSLAYLGARSSLVGNGLLPLSMLEADRAQVFTHPDATGNRLEKLVAAGEWRVGSGGGTFSWLAYHRRQRGEARNGDLNDDYEEGPTDGVSAIDSGVFNRAATRQHGTGLSLQWNWQGDGGLRLALGLGHDRAVMHFSQSAQLGILRPDRGIQTTAEPQDANRLRGDTGTLSAYGNASLPLGKNIRLTLAWRHNATRVRTRDLLVLEPPNLDGDHRYRRFNASLGVTWQLAPAFGAYLNAGDSSRVPTPIELGCADPANPCTLPNALASDPFLEQVVSRSIDAGLRGVWRSVRWQLGTFRSTNRDDILFVGTGTSAGYFTNFGRTRRDGWELSLEGRLGPVEWELHAARLRARFLEGACLLAENNSTRGRDSRCVGGGQDDEIRVNPGNRMPGLPARTLKGGLAGEIDARWRWGLDFRSAGPQWARGNENQGHAPGRFSDLYGGNRQYLGPGGVGGYLVVDGRLERRLGREWWFSLQIANLFDRRYATAATLAENAFAPGGAFIPDSGAWSRETFVSPASPRAAWIGVRYAGGSSARSR